MKFEIGTGQINTVFIMCVYIASTMSRTKCKSNEYLTVNVFVIYIYSTIELNNSHRTAVDSPFIKSQK